MSDQEPELEKKGGGLKKILFILLGLILAILVLAGTVVATLWMSGFFDRSAAQTAEERIAELEAQVAAAEAAEAAEAVDGPAEGPRPPSKEVTKRERFEASYLEMDRPLISNIANSRKVISATVAMMTHYDNRVFDNVERHNFALRSVMLDRMRQITEDELAAPNFRDTLADDLLILVNSQLEELEDFGGIEAVHFTEFVVQ